MYVYTLELKDGKYYIGKTIDPERRLTEHKRGDGSEWTKIYPFINLYNIRKIDDPLEEDLITKQMMREFGVDNVRGGSYSRVVLSDLDKENLNREIYNSNGACFKCGKMGHYLKDCYYKNENRDKTKDFYDMKKCKRCGRNNHLESECYAKHDNNGCRICKGIRYDGTKCRYRICEWYTYCRDHYNRWEPTAP